ncbi:ABC transporter permease [Fructobacillus durionis]|uniref:Putative ABC transport system permease protein n=1 Tax=Fructobacillus durionis TaxID=283737 RepID=A0A1I1HD67_9LACO|nr:ABC transporter permease [Fructobacillus durionis]SFC19060.1 putative ABC transport system permease protein [Fructobacillus durionis]
MFYVKLAFDSLRKNKESYLPFLLAGTAAVALNFLVQLLIYSSGVKNLQFASDIVRLLLVLGQVIIGLLSLVIMIYTYSFLKKGKEKEFGLYSILGMKKSDLVKISLIQQAMSFAITIVTGLITGFVFAKLMILLLVRMVGGKTFGMELSLPALACTIAFFFGVYAVLTIIDAIAVARTKTLDLMKSEKKGASAPKNRWLFFLFGGAALIWGYGLSLTVPSPIKAVNQFFFAVLLVAVATYLLFIAASTLILKALQKKEGYYYQSKHFITVSNMLFRMKQNAVGLASIALLTTMTLVVTVTTASMYFGKADLVQKMFPRDVEVALENKGITEEQVDSLVNKYDLKASGKYTQTVSLPARAAMSKDQHFTSTEYASNANERNIQFMTLDEYQAATGDKQSLKANQVLAYGRNGGKLTRSDIYLGKDRYSVKQNLKSIKGMPSASADSTASFVFVLPTEESLQSATKTFFPEVDESKIMQTSYFFNISGSAKHEEDFCNALDNYQGQNMSFQVKSMTEKVMNGIYGGFFFIGILFSISFILATGLMIYYKQISEGKADQAQFEILQKVGMSEGEIKKTIRSQIIWLFGLPIAVSLIHLSFAMPMINKLLLAFSVPVTGAVYVVMAMTILLMVTIYYIIYKITSHTYYKQVTELN